MASLNTNKDVRLLTLGINVTRKATALPSSTLGNIFTITGGRILIASLTGLVQTLLSGTNSTSVGITPTLSGGASAPTILSAGGVIPVAVGSPVVSKLDASALVVTVNGSLLPAAPYLTVPGSITITTASTVTGTVQWDLTYIPLDVGAQVVAA
jgi:hypothetical protein